MRKKEREGSCRRDGSLREGTLAHGSGGHVVVLWVKKEGFQAKGAWQVTSQRRVYLSFSPPHPQSLRRRPLETKANWDFKEQVYF